MLTTSIFAVDYFSDHLNFSWKKRKEGVKTCYLLQCITHSIIFFTISLIFPFMNSKYYLATNFSWERKKNRSVLIKRDRAVASQNPRRRTRAIPMLIFLVRRRAPVTPGGSRGQRGNPGYILTHLSPSRPLLSLLAIAWNVYFTHENCRLQKKKKKMNKHIHHTHANTDLPLGLSHNDQIYIT